MNDGPKMLLIIGILFILAAGIWQFSGRFIQLGHLPGDISIEKENFKFYMPLGTSLVVSIALSGILWLLRFLKIL